MNEEINVAFFCKKCKEITDVTREGKKYVFMCKTCKSKNVAFGTKRGIAEFFHVKK